MSNDNILTFPGAEPPKDGGGDKGAQRTADDVLVSALGRYEEVIIIGLSPKGAQCISSMPLREAVYELSRAIHRIHEYRGEM